MRILLVDTTAYYPSSPLFLEALEELARKEGHEFAFVDEARYTKSLERSLLHKIAYRALGRRPLTYWQLNSDLVEETRRFRPNLILIVKGAFVSPSTLRRIREGGIGTILVNYATDDPFNRHVSTLDLIEAIPLYDLYACTKRAIMPDARKAGCPNVVFVPFGYKPAVHLPEKPETLEEETRFTSDVLFIGGCDRDRIPYFEALVKAIPDLRLHLYGGYWDSHPILKRYHRGFALGRNYRLAFGGARIVVNLVRQANRDGHVMRSFEIPACGAFMLAERTKEHLEFFKEDKEAAYFSSIEELVAKVRYYLDHVVDRGCIAKAGYERIVGGGNTYEDRLVAMLRAVRSMNQGV